MFGPITGAFFFAVLPSVDRPDPSDLHQRRLPMAPQDSASLSRHSSIGELCLRCRDPLGVKKRKKNHAICRSCSEHGVLFLELSYVSVFSLFLVFLGLEVLGGLVARSNGLRARLRSISVVAVGDDLSNSTWGHSAAGEHLPTSYCLDDVEKVEWSDCVLNQQRAASREHKNHPFKCSAQVVLFGCP